MYFLVTSVLLSNDAVLCESKVSITLKKLPDPLIQVKPGAKIRTVPWFFLKGIAPLLSSLNWERLDDIDKCILYNNSVISYAFTKFRIIG